MPEKDTSRNEIHRLEWPKPRWGTRQKSAEQRSGSRASQEMQWVEKNPKKKDAASKVRIAKALLNRNFIKFIVQVLHGVKLGEFNVVVGIHAIFELGVKVELHFLLLFLLSLQRAHWVHVGSNEDIVIHLENIPFDNERRPCIAKVFELVGELRRKLRSASTRVVVAIGIDIELVRGLVVIDLSVEARGGGGQLLALDIIKKIMKKTFTTLNCFRKLRSRLINENTWRAMRRNMYTWR